MVVAGTEAANPVSQGSKDKESGLYPFVEDMTPFEASLKGLSDARIAIRRQMARIVNEVTLIEGDPKIATNEDHHEPFQSPIAFELRLPEVGTPERLKKASLPLTGKRIIAKTQTEQEHKVRQLARSSLFQVLHVLPLDKSLNFWRFWRHIVFFVVI